MPDYEIESTLSSDEALLAEIRTRFDYCQDAWKDIRDEAQRDMDFISGNPWPEAEKLRREQAGRPCSSLDELTQYTNQLVNEIRQNKRAVKVVPRGYGAQDDNAEMIGDLMREIEYKSNAQSAYACGFENMCHRSYGGWKIVTRYISEKSFDQEIRIVRIPNPDSVYMDPDCKESDYSDGKYAFLLDLIPRKEFKKRWPKAKITDFNEDHCKIASNWIKEDQIQVAEYWRVESEDRTLLQVKPMSQQNDGQPILPISMFEDELPEGETKESLDEKGLLISERKSEKRTVIQYITNGIEILEENKWAGKFIPIVWLTGKELYVDEGSGPKRMLMSMIRLARDPQMLVNYYATCEAELVGMSPKIPFIGYVGQFHNKEQWEVANTTPVAYLEANAVTEATGSQILPLPVRPNYTADLQQLELAKEAARRSIQAAMGLSSLPTNAQRLNDKSGVALKQIDENEDRGSFHFIDNFEMGLEYSGRIINDLRPIIYDTPREVGVRGKDDNHRVVKINQKYTEADGTPKHYDMSAGEYEVTIATGPSYQSEREASDEFVKTIVPELEGLQIDPGIKQKLLAMLVKTQNIGPMGDKIAELLDPQNGDAQTKAALQQAQQQSQQYQEMVAKLQTENQELLLEKKAKIIEKTFDAKEADKDRELKLAMAEVTTKAQVSSDREQLTADVATKLGLHLTKMAHETATQAVEHAHAHKLADKQAATQSEMASQNAMHAQDAAKQQAELEPSDTGKGQS